ncbi:MAG: hypothetical protein Q9211_002603 [Gyalolechia sp. 1 TL-2023]
MAPEIFRRGEQTDKTPGEVYDTILSTASNEGTVSQIREMVIPNPDNRPSAAQMLIKLFNGVGLSTPRSQVPDLSKGPVPAAATAPAAAPPLPVTRRIMQRRRKRLRKRVNRTVAKGQDRVRKPHPARRSRRAACPVHERRMI